jgi:lipopolysaccharide transport system permease protein
MKMENSNPFSCLVQHRRLIMALTGREIAGRYRGSVLGLFWSVVNPLILLSIYTLIFGQVFQARWTHGNGDTKQFAILLFSGMLIFTFFSDCISRAPLLIVNNVNYVKKIVFPLAVQGWVLVFAGAFNLAVSLVVLLAAHMLLLGTPPWTTFLFPLVALPLFLWVSGVVWFLASLGVFFRDTSQIVTHVTTMLMFLSPLFYPVDAFPEKYRVFFNLNPLAFVIEQARAVLVFGATPTWGGWALYTALSAVIACIGYRWFTWTRKGFADVL